MGVDARGEPDGFDLKRCVRCGAWIPDTVTRCAHCESPQSPEATAKGPRKAAGGGSVTVTQALIWANVAFFLWSLFLHVRIFGGENLLGLIIGGPDARVLARAGWYEHAAVVERDQWWRIMTACFLHGGLMHIGFNLFALNQLGRLAEQIFGPLRFLTIYLVCGACSMVAGSLWYTQFPSAGGQHPVVGASGAIFGVAGLLIVYLKAHGTELGRRIGGALLKNIALLLVLGFVIPFISNTGHVGGLIPGLAFGFLVGDRFADRVRPHAAQAWRVAAVFCVALTAVCLLQGVVHAW